MYNKKNYTLVHKILCKQIIVGTVRDKYTGQQSYDNKSTSENFTLYLGTVLSYAEIYHIFGDFGRMKFLDG